MGVWLGAPPLCLGHASLTCSAGQTLQSNACNTIQGLGLRVWGLLAPQRSGFQGRFWGWAAAVAGTLTCWSLCLHFLESAGCPKEAALYTDGSFSQEAESMVTFENCHRSFGCMREPFGQRRAGELKASLFREAGTAGFRVSIFFFFFLGGGGGVVMSGG